MPVLKDSALYNCRILILNSKIILIRPKTRLAMNGNYRENRWFTAWGTGYEPSLTWFVLPPIIAQLTNQTKVPFGDKAIVELITPSSDDFSSNVSSLLIGFEICEELWHADAQHVNLYGKRGCHLIMNSSASYWELRKLNQALSLMRTATFKSGGIYAFANLVGCDGGGRLCYYGRSSIILNGDIVTMTTSKDNIFDEVQIAIAFIDLNDVIQYRSQNNIKVQNYNDIGDNLIFNSKNGFKDSNINNVNTITISDFVNLKSSQVKKFPYTFPQLNCLPEEEIMMYCSLWLWDYLRRCPGLEGFIVPLSGGLDSSSVACLVFSLCTLLSYQVEIYNEFVINKLKEILKETNVQNMNSPQKICNKLLKTLYLATRYSGENSKNRAESLAKHINAQFLAFNFDGIFKQIQQTVPSAQNAQSGVVTLQQQNVQARLRMVLTYYLSEGKRLVLATGNVDEALVGYLTKYDCSSADLNPIGSISKHDLRSFMNFCKKIIPKSDHVLDIIIDAIPSAELTGEDQKDEDDLGLTYDELSIIGRMRRGQFGTYGPFGVFCKLWDEKDNPIINSAIKGLKDKPNPEEIAKKVKRFFTLHARNRHKQTVLTPALHSETYSPDDNRFDHRQFLFDTQWTWQFKQIDKKVEEIKRIQAK